MKRLLYILGLVFVYTALLLVMLFMLARDSKVQTAALQVVANELSDYVGTTVRVGKIEYHFFNRLEIDGVYVEDQQQDTLLYAGHLNARFDFLGFFSKRIIFREVQVDDAYLNVYHTGNTPNYQFLTDLIPKTEKDTTKKPLPMVEVKNVSLRDIRLRYDDWHIRTLNTDLALNHLDSDSIDAQISSLNLIEEDGFEIKDLQVRAILTENRAELQRLLIELPRSHFSLTAAIDFDKDSIQNSLMRLGIARADITLGDIGRFVPALKNVNGTLHIEGNIDGTVGSLHAAGLELDYEDYKILRGDITLVGLPNVDTAFVNAQLQDLFIERGLLQDLISDIKGKPYQLPPMVSRLGNMHYEGALTGRIDSLILNGNFSSRLGNITTDGSLRSRNRLEDFFFKGRVATKRFALGQLLGNKDLGNISLDVKLDGKTGKNIPLRAKVDATIPSLRYRRYTYRNASIKGMYGNREFEGDMQIHNPNLDFAFAGLIDLTQEMPIANFTLDIDHLRLGELNLSEKYSDADLQAQVTINGSGSSLDNANGYLYIDSLYFIRSEKTLFMNQLRILAETGQDEPTNFKIQSDFLNANVSGDYVFSQLPLAVQRIIALHIPQAISSDTRQKLAATTPSNSLTYYAYFKNLDMVSDVMDLPVTLSKMPTIKGFIDETQGKFALQVGVPQLRAGNQQIDDITLNLDNRKQQINLSVDAYKHASQNYAGQRMGDLKAILSMVARQDSLYLNLNFENTDSLRTAGGLYTATHFSQHKGKPKIDLEVLPSDFLLMDSLWHFGSSHIIYSVADTTLQVNHFSVGNESHFIQADGVASKRESDSISIALKDIVLDYLLEYTNVKKSITFGGAVTGSVSAYSLFSKPMFDAEVWMMNASINDSPLGDVHALAELNKETKSIDIWGAVTEKQDTVVRLTGLVAPQQSAWDLFIYPDSVNLGFINFWTQGILEDIEGRGSGEVHVYGRGKDTHVEGKALAQNAGIGIGFLGTKYYFTDSVYLDYDKIRFDNILLHDEENNYLMLDGSVNHDGNFKNFTYEIDVSPVKALVMNMPAEDQAMFYGKVYATGNAQIRGNDTECRINANARTDANSRFSLSLATASTASDNNFITFVDHRAVRPTSTEEQTIRKTPKTKVLIDLQIEATPDALVNLVIDPKTGDHLEARGQGDLKLTYDVNANDIKLFGTYMLDQGKFFFTFENLLRKEFTLRSGSKVTFAGNPMNLQIDASAHYSTSASLRDLFGSDYTNVSTNRSSVPVNCIIYLKESLMNPVISFGIELPNSDESVANQVRNVINTDEMMMREIIYLLVFNRFYTPEYLQTTTSTGLNETYSLLSSTVTGQINNWLRKLTNNFTVGFNIRADGQGEDATQEYETQFQYQPNNRLIINGNFGYRYNDISNQPIFGNLDVEYLLTPSGMWRAKAYTHSVDKYSLKEAHTVQGVGLTFKYDFNIGRQQKKKKNKTETEEVNKKDGD